MSKPLILIIDDNEDYLELLTEGLSDNFASKCATDLQSAEDLLYKENLAFDIALVDENIGSEKGSDWIKKQVERGQGAKSYVLYSGLASEDAILKGLACGADDFLSKPISLLALNNKLEQLIKYQNKIKNFEADLKSKENVINISMAQASKYGSCMQLTSKLNKCFTEEQIRDEVFNYFYSMQLVGCIAFSPLKGKQYYYHSKNGFCSPVEKGVIQLLRDKPRLFRFGNRTIFNHPLVSILVLNLEEGSIDTDIYIDALASVIECIGARMEFIAYKESLVDVQEQIEKAVATTKRMVEISKHHQQEVMNEIVAKVGMSFHVLDLNEEQEDYLTNLVHEALKKHSQDDINFMEVSQLLDQALNSVEELKTLSQSVEVEEVDFDEEDELF